MNDQSTPAISPPLGRGPSQGTPTTAPASTDAQVRYDQTWMTSVLRPLLIAILAACLNVALLTFLRYAVPWLPLAYMGAMITIGVMAALIGCISTTWLAQPAQRMKRNAGYRTAEIALLLSLTRLAAWATVGNWPSITQILTRPLETMLDGYFIISSFVVGLSWFMATGMTSDMLRMALQPDEIEAARLRASREITDATPPNYTDRRAVLGGFVSRWLVGGVLLVVLSAAVRIGPPANNGFFALTQQNIDPAVVTAVVVYFLVGLILMSQGQLAVLRARWTLEKVPSTVNVLRNWPFYTFLLIATIGFLATLLPFGGTFYFAQILYTIIWFIYNALLTFFQLIFGLFLLLVSLLTGEQSEQPPAERPSFQAPQFEPPLETAAGLPPWLGGAVFWLFTALLLGYAAYIYFTGRGLTMSWLARFWQMLRARWAELFGTYQEWQLNRVRRNAAGADDPENSLFGGLLSWLRLRNLTPDQQVRYFYLSTLHRAQQIGVPRRASETPSQYGPRLVQEVAHLRAAHLRAAHLRAQRAKAEQEGTDSADTDAEEPMDTGVFESEQSIRELTDAFLHVRYAGQHAPPERLPYLKELWERIKKRLLKRR